jgi:hypothetical protein
MHGPTVGLENNSEPVAGLVQGTRDKIGRAEARHDHNARAWSLVVRRLPQVDDVVHGVAPHGCAGAHR